ncbi:MAG: LysR family transcriptional regulator [Rhodospirillales bacterium]|nr:LysR family transcriptional regulator [Rhodospirillales bacterium]
MTSRTEEDIPNTINVLAALVAFRHMVKEKNISAAARRLGVHRHTVRSKIKILQTLLSDPLISKDSPRGLTVRGEALHHHTGPLLHTVEAVLDLILRPTSSVGRGRKGFEYYYQRHPLWNTEDHHPLIHHAYDSWLKAKGQYKAPQMESIIDWSLVYRQEPGGWRFVEIGKNAAYVKWLGKAWADSAPGRFNADDASGDDLSIYAADGYHDAMTWGNPILEHVHTIFGRGEEGPAEWASYQRIILPCTMPQGDKILVVPVAVTNDIKINILGSRKRKSTPDFLLTEYPVD